MIFDEVHHLFRIRIRYRKLRIRIRILQKVLDPCGSGSTTLLLSDEFADTEHVVLFSSFVKMF
jgi:Rad3-related DNA helicase